MMKSLDLGGRYTVDSLEDNLLGEGGMGKVFLGKDTESGAQVAIKTLHKDKFENQPEVLERFRREGELLRQLDHPNIVKMLDALEVDGVHYLVMEYVEGGDLNGLLEKEGKLSIEQTLAIALELADALTRAHHLNIIHRDIKPSNVLLATDSTPRLTDFGIAHFDSDLSITRENEVLGTMPYLSPEGCIGEGLDVRSDVWSFGVLLYELLTGNVPFGRDNEIAVLALILYKELPDIQADHPEISDTLADLIYRMLVKDPNERIPSVRLVGAELEGMIKGFSINPTSKTGKEMVKAIEGNTRLFEKEQADEWQRPKQNLPIQMTPFVGRENELAELARMLNYKNRFVTITAPGGMGKTRLVLAFASQFVEDGNTPEKTQKYFEDGVYFIELAPLSDPSIIITAIAQATGYQFHNEDTESSKQQLLNFLSDKSILLIMDNYEHLLDGAQLIPEILIAAPNVVIFATSRQLLGQPGEIPFHLGGMEFLTWETPEDAQSYAAVKLFVNSARRARPDFKLNQDNLEHVAHICQMVGGMPLGIVLAASWLALLSPEEIAQEIKGGINIFETTGGEVEERHENIRTVFDQSWIMMNKAEQKVFMALSVFRGGFTREAVQAITEADLRTLLNLVNKSLIRRDASTGRYQVHELLRQYGKEKLDESGDLDKVNDAHCVYYLNRLKGFSEKIRSAYHVKVAEQIDTDFDNIQKSWNRAVDQRHLELLGDASIALAEFTWFRAQYMYQSIGLCEYALQTLENDKDLTGYHRNYGRILTALAHIGFGINYDAKKAIQSAQDGLAHLKKAKDPYGVAYAFGVLGWWLGISGIDPENAVNMLEESHQKFIDLGDKSLAGIALLFIGRTLNVLGKDFIQVLDVQQKAVEILRESGNLFYMSGALGFNGLLMISQGEYEKAKELFEEALLIQKQNYSVTNQPSYLNSLANIAIIQGDFKHARKLLQEALQITTQYKFARAQSLILKDKSKFMSIEGRHEEASKLLEEARQAFPQFRDKYPRAMLAYRRGDYETAHNQFESLLENTTPLSERVFLLWLGMAQIKLGKIELAQQSLFRGLKGTYSSKRRSDYPQAIYGFVEILNSLDRKVEAAEKASLIQNHPVAEYEFKRYATELLAELKSELPLDDYQAAIERGKSLDLDTVVQELLDEFGGDY